MESRIKDNMSPQELLDWLDAIPQRKAEHLTRKEVYSLTKQCSETIRSLRYLHLQHGETIHDRDARAAMQALLSNDDYVNAGEEMVAEMAFIQADAMAAERKERS